MKVNFTFKDIQIDGAELNSITDCIFSAKVGKDFPLTTIKALADDMVAIHIYPSFILLIFERKEIANYELYREEE